jgi:hypothetical protein
MKLPTHVLLLEVKTNPLRHEHLWLPLTFVQTSEQSPFLVRHSSISETHIWNSIRRLFNFLMCLAIIWLWSDSNFSCIQSLGSTDCKCLRRNVLLLDEMCKLRMRESDAECGRLGTSQQAHHLDDFMISNFYIHSIVVCNADTCLDVAFRKCLRHIV